MPQPCPKRGDTLTPTLDFQVQARREWQVLGSNLRAQLPTPVVLVVLMRESQKMAEHDYVCCSDVDTDVLSINALQRCWLQRMQLGRRCSAATRALSKRERLGQPWARPKSFSGTISSRCIGRLLLSAIRGAQRSAGRNEDAKHEDHHQRYHFANPRVAQRRHRPMVCNQRRGLKSSAQLPTLLLVLVLVENAAVKNRSSW